MPPQSEPLSSYSSLPNSEIRVSHVPPSSPTPTSIILVTLYRPNNHNAFTDTMMRELESIFTLLSLDDRVRCVVLTGHGRMFCAGADLQRGFKGGEGMEEGSRGHRDGYAHHLHLDAELGTHPFPHSQRHLRGEYRVSDTPLAAVA